MRKTIFVFFILLGAAVGVFAAGNEGIGLEVIFGGFCAMVGAIIGGVLAGYGRRSPRSTREFKQVDLLSDEQDKRVRNFWLDQGRLNPSPGLPHADDLDPFSHEP